MDELDVAHKVVSPRRGEAAAATLTWAVEPLRRMETMLGVFVLDELLGTKALLVVGTTRKPALVGPGVFLAVNAAVIVSESVPNMKLAGYSREGTTILAGDTACQAGPSALRSEGWLCRRGGLRALRFLRRICCVPSIELALVALLESWRTIAMKCLLLIVKRKTDKVFRDGKNGGTIVEEPG